MVILEEHLAYARLILTTTKTKLSLPALVLGSPNSRKTYSKIPLSKRTHKKIVQYYEVGIYLI